MQGRDIIFFDLDGTLTDSKEGIFNSIRYALKFFDIEETDDEKLSLFLGPPLVQAFMKYYQMSEENAELALVKYRENFVKKGIYQLSMYDGIDNMLKALKENRITVCLATSKPLKFAEQIVKRIGIAPYFDYLAGATMDETRNEKADIIDYVITQNGFHKDRILMVGDRENDIKGAHQNHVEVLGVLYGYGSRLELETAGCIHFAKTVAETKSFILQ